ncbi:MAG: ATP-binding cassette domain-containing protein, partial [Lachnospiraceae bacterium]|nr:ATP-binding cassette domain-containing protein [Lachnospiraceae bacterium]
LKDLIRQVGLDPESKLKVGKYSMGMKQRLGIAQAIMDKPELLLLDEPMNGLDNHGVDEMRRLFKTLKEQGTTIIIASHIAEDIQILCDAVTYLDHGRIVEEKV